MRKIIILWYTIGNNFGDRLLYEVVKNKIEQHGYLCESCEIGVSYRELEKKLDNIDFIWFAGGGIIERGIPNIILNMDRVCRDFPNIRYGVTGLSIGDFDYSRRSEQLSFWVRNSTFFYTRDEYTEKTLNNISKSKIAKFSADVVFSSQLIKKYKKNAISPILGVNFRNVPYIDLTGDLEWDQWSDEINQIAKKYSYGCSIIPDESSEQKRLINLNCNVPEYSVDSALSTIANSKIIVAMRFHVILVASMLGVPVIPINYCPKVGRLAHQLQIEKLLLEIHDFASLASKFSSLINSYDFYSKTLKNNSDRLRAKSEEMFDKIFKDL
ncbi:MAG: polysaccharide pyruvyl transferase family protein [Aeromonadales bacterium]|nr:polysaccharide pyruvyl transferase family protein [Aeromonadales bacterium]MDY2891288.1 polysaccharide pyruvyl transferase family protein [Succinivibrio sp.]